MLNARFSMLLRAVALVALITNGCEKEENPQAGETLTYTFEQGLDGWSAGFADLPVLSTQEDSSLYELGFGRSRLPKPLDTTRYALMLKGHNRSDDLFMFLKRKITGLEAGREYRITFAIDVASNAATGAIGIGGAPGESVYLKAGATGIEPKAEAEGDFSRMNIDKGQQSTGGADMQVIGNLANGTDKFDYVLLPRGNSNQPFRARANAQGELWLIVGTDSGFEGLTTLYYDRIRVVME